MILRFAGLIWQLPISLLLLLFSVTANAQPHSRMMQATFKIVGDSTKIEGAEETGVAFVVLLPGDAPSSGATRVALVTAAHFLDNVKGDCIDLIARYRHADGSYEKKRVPIRIRDGDRQIPVRHPDSGVDLAVIPMERPSECELAPLALDQLATTRALAGAAGQVGRRVFAPGYPFAIEASDAGFPVLRSGHIASYPPPQAHNQRILLLDIAISEGLSGSPVYLVDRGEGTSNEEPTSGPLVIGMIVGQHELTSEFKGPFETRKVTYPLNLAIALHAPAIRELIGSLIER